MNRNKIPSLSMSCFSNRKALLYRFHIAQALKARNIAICVNYGYSTKEIPIAFSMPFDPRRVAILLIGGNKSGYDRWYEEYVPVADILNLNQAALSKMENQSDMRVSTLRRILAAMGGELKIIAQFPDGEVVINQFDLAATSEK